MYSSYRPTCFYRDCNNRNSVNSRKSFFELPSDNRREVWLKNSGISDEEASRIILYRRPIWICEDHFEPKYMQYLPDGRKILLQHPGSVPVPFTTATKTKLAEVTTVGGGGGGGGGGLQYDETATHMLQLFETGGNESDLHDYFLARNYIQTDQAAAAAVAASNEQQQQLLQNYMLQAQLQQSQLFFSQPGTTAAVVQPNAAVAAQAIVQPPTSVVTQPAPLQVPQVPVARKPRTYNRAPRNTYIEEEPEPPKKEVMCYSVQAGERQKAAQKSSAEPASDDIEDMLDTFFIVNDKQQTSSSSNGGILLGN